jgi:hypothetical protein
MQSQSLEGLWCDFCCIGLSFAGGDVRKQKIERDSDSNWTKEGTKQKRSSDPAVCSNEQGVGGCVHSTNKSKGWPMSVGRRRRSRMQTASVGIEGEKTIGPGIEWSARMWERCVRNRYCLQTDRSSLTLADVEMSTQQ